MSSPSEAVAGQRTASAVAGAALLIAVLNTVGMTLLFGTEISFMAAALDWSIAGLLHLPAPVAVATGIVPVAAALYATFWIGLRAWRFERSAAT